MSGRNRGKAGVMGSVTGGAALIVGLDWMGAAQAISRGYVAGHKVTEHGALGIVGAARVAGSSKVPRWNQGAGIEKHVVVAGTASPGRPVGLSSVVHVGLGRK